MLQSCAWCHQLSWGHFVKTERNGSVGQLAHDHHTYCTFPKDLADTHVRLLSWECCFDGQLNKFSRSHSVWLSRSSVTIRNLNLHVAPLLSPTLLSGPLTELVAISPGLSLLFILTIFPFIFLLTFIPFEFLLPTCFWKGWWGLYPFPRAWLALNASQEHFGKDFTTQEDTRDRQRGTLSCTDQAGAAAYFQAHATD